MSPLALDGSAALGTAILLGFMLGFVLVKSDFAWDTSFVKFLSLRSARLLKIFLLTLAFGAVGFYFCARAGAVRVNAAPGYMWSLILGGVLSGGGMALAGFFPAGAVTALGAGRLYAIWTLVGMGAAILCKPFISKVIREPWCWGESLPDPKLATEAFGIGNMVWAVAFGAILLTAVIQLLMKEDEGDK